MTELWLTYKDENGQTKRISVEGEKFVIGRHSECDLSITHSSLSRSHAQIERFGDIFVLSDLGSSNGTTINGAKLEEPVALKKGDCFNLGGGFEFEADLVSDEDADAAAVGAAQKESGEQAAKSSSSGAGAAFSSSSGEGNSLSMSFFILAPLFGLIALLFVGGGIFLIAGNSGGPVRSGGGGGNFIPSDKPDKTPQPVNDDDAKGDETPSPTAKPTVESRVTTANSVDDSTMPTPPAQDTGELDKIERNALLLTRRIAINDRNYVFTRGQLNEINNRLKSFKNSDALRDNLRAVRQSATQFEQLAQSRGLKPQFLAVAALARLGNQRGNPLQTAQSMLPVLGELKITLGNELADENLLIIAAFDQGERGEFRAMRNTVEVLSQKPGVDASKARTIWYLREKGKLSDAQYEFALRFLAIGAISQNPKDFNVETEPVVFN